MDDALDELETAEAGCIRSWEAGDVEGLMGYFAHDAALLAAGRPLARGRAAARKMLASVLELPGIAVKLESQGALVARSGDLGYTLTTYETRLADGRAAEDNEDAARGATGSANGNATSSPGGTDGTDGTDGPIGAEAADDVDTLRGRADPADEARSHTGKYVAVWRRDPQRGWLVVVHSSSPD